MYVHLYTHVYMHILHLMYIENSVRKVLERFICPITPRGVGALTRREHWTFKSLYIYNIWAQTMCLALYIVYIIIMILYKYLYNICSSVIARIMLKNTVNTVS